MKAKKKFKISVKHHPRHSYYFTENIEAASLRGAKQTNIYKEYLIGLSRGRYASIMIEQV